MIRKLLHLIFMIMAFLTAGCVKETYDMSKLSKKAHISPTMAISAIKGDISLSDIVKSGDTVVFDQNKSVKIVFKKDSVFDLTWADFISSKNMVEFKDINYSKGSLGLVATIKPDSFNFEIDEILSHITGTFGIINPSIKINYYNSFTNPVELKLNATGKRKDKTVNLNLEPFTFLHPVTPADPEVTASFKIDKSNSNLPELLSMPPEKIYFSGTATMNTPGYLPGNNRLIGSVEVEVPLEFRFNNLQFTDTVDNFLKDDGNSNDGPLKPENFKLLRIDFSAKNGFPLGVSLKMSLYNSVTQTITNTVDAAGILKPALVDSNGKVTGVTETSTSIEFTEKFFSSINKADKIIFHFTFNTTENGSKDVKIYSDYRIAFNAAMVMKPDISLK